jgi:hypothetical protein
MLIGTGPGNNCEPRMKPPESLKIAGANIAQASFRGSLPPAFLVSKWPPSFEAIMLDRENTLSTEIGSRNGFGIAHGLALGSIAGL